MKTTVAIVALAVAALYLYNSQPSPPAGQIAKQEAATPLAQTPTVTVNRTQSAQHPQSTSKLLEPVTSAPRSTSIVVAPMPKVGLKTGPNAQTDLTPTINRLKTGPNAQTDLTMKRSW